MTRPDEIYIGAVYRVRNRGIPVVKVTAVDATHVHYEAVGGWSYGCSPIDSFAEHIEMRVFPGEPTVEDVIALFRRMSAPQQAQVLKAISSPALFLDGAP